MIYHFIVNPNAGNGRGLKSWNKARKRLDKKGVSYDVYFTTGSGDASRKAAEFCGPEAERSCIVAVGGDGTASEVLEGINFASGTVMGYIPAGSGNDLARSLSLESNVNRRLDEILDESRIEYMDYGILSYSDSDVNRRFLVSSGAGYDAAVCHLLSRTGSKNLLNKFGIGNLAYMTGGVREFIMTKPVSGYLLLDGVRRVEFNNILFVSCHIQPYEGGGFKFAPMADPRDGKLEVCVVTCSFKPALVPALLRAKVKGLRSGGAVKSFRCRELTAHFDRPLPIHTDGECIRAHKDIMVSCVGERLQFIR